MKERLIQKIRPYASRVLNRLDILVRSAVERTTLPASVNSLHTKIDKLTTDIATLQENFSHVQRQNLLAASLASAKFDQIQAFQYAHQQEIPQLPTRLVIPLSNGFIAAHNRYGYLVFDQSDPALINYLADGALAGPGMVAFVEQFLQSGDRFLDVGANVGLYTMIAARKVGNTGSVLAIGPAPAAAGSLRFCIEINQVADLVDIQEVAAGSDRTLGRNSAFETSKTRRAVRAEMKSLDELVAPATTFALAKINVDGSEIDVLNGMRRILEDNPDMPVITEFNPSHITSSGQTPAAWLEKVCGLGFQIYEIDDATQKIQCLRNDADLTQVSSINLLLVKNPAGAVAKFLPSNGAS